MKRIEVHFANGDSIITRINGSDAQILSYFKVGSTFNVGMGPDDNMQAVSDIQFL